MTTAEAQIEAELDQLANEARKHFGELSRSHRAIEQARQTVLEEARMFSEDHSND